MAEIETTPVDLNDLNQWLRLDDFLERYPQFPESQIRWILRFRKEKGFDHCSRKIGRHWYIHKQLFHEWVLSLKQ